MVEHILLWPGVLWTVRIALVIVVTAFALATLLYFGRFLRPKHIKAILLADPPRISHIEAEAGGNKVAMKLDHVQATQLDAISVRVTELERAARAIVPLEPPQED